MCARPSHKLTPGNLRRLPPSLRKGKKRGRSGKAQGSETNEPNRAEDIVSFCLKDSKL